MSKSEPDHRNALGTSPPTPRGIAFLLAVSCVYVGLPSAVFFLGWLRWWAAWPAVILLLGAVVGLLRKAVQAGLRDRSDSVGGTSFPAGRGFFVAKGFSWSQGALWAGVCLLVVSLSGAGGVGLQEGDYFKHNAVLKHLMESPWPVWIPTDQGAFPLVYYPGWYLPGAVVGKWFGWAAANGLIFLWTAAGVMLALAWFAALVGRCQPMVLAIFFLFSAPDVLGAAIFKLIGWDPGPPRPPPVPDAWGIDWYALRWWNWELRWWAGPYTWNYCSHMELVFWVPQQALGAWICSGMMAAGIFWSRLQGRCWALVPLALSALWSPFVTLGLTPFLLADIFGGSRGDRDRVAPGSGWLSGPNLAALALLGLAGLYYAAHFAPLPFRNDPRSEFRILGFEDWPTLIYLVRLGFFWMIDVGTIAGLILLVRRPRKSPERIVFCTAVGVLLVLSLFRYGLNNDLGMRVSMPWLFMLAVLLAKGAIRKRLPPVRRWILWGTLALMSATPTAEVYRHLCEMRRRGEWIAVPPREQVQSLWELNVQIRAKSGNDFFIRQYIGSPDGLFFRYLAAPPE